MRFLPHSDEVRADMLRQIGARHIDDFFACVPHAARQGDFSTLPLHRGEMEVERDLTRLAARNMTAGSVPFFLGAGAYRHHIPAAVDHLIQRSEFLTCYTPYQAEIAQGTLQVLFEFQTQVCELLAMDVANASMYDGSTAAAEAVAMACRITGKNRAVLCGGLHPHYRDTISGLCAPCGVRIHGLAPDLPGPDNDFQGALLSAINDETACIVVQSPSVFGDLRSSKALAEAAHERGALLVTICTEAVAPGLLRPPGEDGADIAVAEGQSLGNPLGFGGPYVGLFAARRRYVRQMPGRLCGQSVDADGKRGFVLTLATREQHIRRARATSNICTNSGLCCLAFSIHMTLLGGHGLARLARANHISALKLRAALSDIPHVEILNPTFFNEFTVRLPGCAHAVTEELAARNILGGIPLSRLFGPDTPFDNLLLMASTEVTQDSDHAELAGALREIL